ncbi:Thymidylate kinase [Agyrium rufum]|nr:Thymidylate kinase [Agyrium rufum]
MRGALIVIEGLDRAGKSTQCERLCARLEKEGKQVKRMRFPDRTTAIGTSINAYLQGQSQIEDHAIHLLFSANRWEASTSMRADIAAGINLVVDRYYYSGIVYSAAKRNLSLDLTWALRPDVGLPRPDLCVFLGIGPEEAAKRGGFGEERYEEAEMQKGVREMFGKLLEEVERVGGQEEKVEAVDAGKGLDEVEAEIWKVVKRRLEEIDFSRELGAVQPLTFPRRSDRME